MKYLVVMSLAISWSCLGGDPDIEKMCGDLHDTGKAIMESRQTGVSAPDMMKLLRGVEGGTDGIREAYRKIIIDAYDSPRYQTERMQRKAAVDFANKLYVGCYKGAGT